jgi:PAS domain S-box-containing protein
MKAAKQAILEPSRQEPAGSGADLFRALAENSSDMILHLEFRPERRLVYVNPACYAITGFTPEEFYAHPGVPGIEPNSEYFPQFLALIDPDNPWGTTPVELCWKHKNGTEVWTEETKTVIRDTDGHPTDMVFITRDITRRKATQKALLESEEHFAAAFNASPYNNVWNGASPGMSYPGIDVDTFEIAWDDGILQPGDTMLHLDMVSGTDAWNFIYLIMSVRSETLTSGTTHYIINRN